MDFFATLAVDFFIKLFLILIGIFLFFYLIYRLQLIIRSSKFVHYSDRINNNSEIKNLLSEALGQRARFKVRLNGRHKSFLSGLVDVSSGHVIIDALFPEEGNEMIKESEFISIDFQIKEKGTKTFFIPYTFDSKYIKEQVFKGYPAIRIEVPTLIERNQKRSYYRMEPSVNSPLFVRFDIQNRQMTEKIANISGGGVGFYTNLTKDVLLKGYKIDEISIELPGHGEVRSPAIIRSFLQNDNPVLIENRPYLYCCGVEFDGIEKAAQEKIIAYIIKQEREELRRMQRVE